jgi:photosystem II stability/assembly factor-like uncharacterized protein
VAVLLLGFAVPVNMVGNWYQQFMPNLNNMPLSDVFFLDSLTGWAVTNNNLGNDSGYIVKTTSGGDNWNIKLHDRRDFGRVKFINQNTGFVCGGTGSGTSYLYKSTDGGENWFIVSGTSFANFFNDMSVLNKDTIWLADPDGLFGGVFRTTNSGVNWTGISLQASGGNPNRIYMYDKNIGFASSSTGGALYKTTNGGESWNRITGQDGFTDMRFIDTLTGYKCRSLIKKSTDGGLTWSQQVLPSGGNIIGSGMSKITYVSTNGDTLWGVSGEIIVGSGTRGTLYHTSNGGINWTFQLPDTSIHIVQYNYGIFTNRYFGWNYATNTGIHTTNGGDTIFYTGLIQTSNEVPREYELMQNYPNPFNPRTIIPYRIKKTAYVSVIVYDITGRRTDKLVDQKQQAGEYEVDFIGEFAASGVYFYQLIINSVAFDTRKMILLK